VPSSNVGVRAAQLNRLGRMITGPSTFHLARAAAIAGLSAALLGPVIFSAYKAMVGASVEFPPTGVVDLFLVAALCAAIGLCAATLLGFPILLSLRKHSRLSGLWVTGSGAAVGLAVAVLLWWAMSMRWPAIPLGVAVGTACGLVAWILMRLRPNKSLERTRAR
jgi:hypothetical protein